MKERTEIRSCDKYSLPFNGSLLSVCNTFKGGGGEYLCIKEKVNACDEFSVKSRPMLTYVLLKQEVRLTTRQSAWATYTSANSV